MSTRRADLGLGSTANGGTAGSWAPTQRAESSSTLNHSTRPPTPSEVSHLINVNSAHDTAGGRTVLLGHTPDGVPAATSHHRAVKEPFLCQDGTSSALMQPVIRDSIAADAASKKFANNPDLQLSDVELSTPGDPSRGADLMVRLGNNDYDLTFTHDYGRGTTSLEAYNFRTGPTHLNDRDKQLLFTDVTGRAGTGDLQSDLNTLFQEIGAESAQDPDADEHLKLALNPKGARSA